MTLVNFPANTTIRVATTLNGTLRGRGADRKPYGRHEIEADITVGVSYSDVLRDSLVALASDGFVDRVIAGCSTHPCDEDTATKACFAIFQDLSRSLNGTGSSRPSVYTPAVDSDGNTINGVKVYSGNDESKQGNLYVFGMKGDFTVTKEDPNGSVPKSTPKSALTEAKKVARRLLPVGQWCQYPLNGNWSISPATLG